MKNKSISSLALLLLNRTIKNTTGRNYLKSLPSLITPTLRDDVYNRLLLIDSKFGMYLPAEANITVSPTAKDYGDVILHFKDWHQIKNLKCYNSELRIKMIKKKLHVV